MSDLASTVAAWTGAIGVILTWMAKLASFMLKRRICVTARLLDGPRLKLVNKSAVAVDIQPIKWGSRWDISGNPEGVKYVKDFEGDHIRLDPTAELTLAFLPDQGSMGGVTLKPETVSKLLEEGGEAMYVYRRDGKVLRRIDYRDIKKRLLERLNKTS